MTDIEKTFGTVPVAPRGRRPVNGWPLVSAVLLVVLVAVLGYALFSTLRFQADVARKLTDMERIRGAKLRQLRQETTALEHNLAEEKGKAIALSFRLVNPDLISDDGQEISEDLLDALLGDPNVAFIALLDDTGAVCAATDLRLKSDEPPIGVTRLVITRPGLHGADVEVLGPITDSYNNQIGTVRVGIVYGASARPPAKETPNPQPTPAPKRTLPEPDRPESVPNRTDLNNT